ncbi:MAG: putative 2OG-Fe(II) oxygenase [Pseudomonadota bacterium]
MNPLLEATSLFRRGLYENAAKLCRELLEKDDSNLTAHHILGKIAYLRERYDESIRHLERVCDEHCTNLDILIEYGRALRLAGRAKEAIPFLRRVLQSGKTYVAHLELGLALAETSQDDEARRMLEAALTLKPDCPYSIRRLGHIARRQGDYATAIRHYEKLTILFPKTIHSYPDLIKTHLMAGNPQAALEACDACLGFEPACTGVLAFKYIALSELGDSDGAKYLHDPERLVRRIGITPPDEFNTIEQFNRRLSTHILHNTIRTKTPERYTTTHGWQTQNGTLFQNDTELGKQMAKIIDEAVEEYVANLPTDPNHPVFAGAPTATHIESWAVVLEEHGHQAPHIHPKSWLSGCYYVELPEDFGSQPESNAGCIAFGQGEIELHPLRQPETTVFRPRAGDMILFPSYFWHHTYPLQSKGKRISLAFDVVPSKGWGK